MRIAFTPIGWPLAAALVAATVGGAAAPAPAQSSASSPVLQVNTGRGRLITLARPMSDVFVASDSIADVQIRSATQIYVFGKAQGETTISATNKAGAVIYSATVRVGNNFDSIQQMLNLAMPEAHIVATPMNGLILLTGIVAAPADSAEAERLVQAFVGDSTKVLSRLRTATPLQVNLQVKFAEVSRSFVKNIGVRLRTNNCVPSCTGTGFLGSAGNPGTITIDPATGLKKFTLQEGAERSTMGLFGRALGTDFLAALDLGETIGQVSTLANPNLTALSGETGTFLAGGEIPIPISQGLGAVSVEYKQYGISLSYTPTVLSDGRISLRVRPEVSQLSAQGSVQMAGTTIPALTTRRAETTVELGSGQSFMIAGLLQNDHQNTIEKTPGIGDVPILGALFRSNGFKRNETELVIVITPYLVKPVNANDIVLPTDGYKAPTDLGRVFLGELGGGVTGGDRPKPSMAPPATAVPAFGASAPVFPAPKAEERREEKAPPPAKPKKGAVAAPGFSIN
ncbi:type II and III secretion system protein family protein [Sphingomonas sp. So64.6b]|uniref:type II and III secretion system protein family protein n=1 Tax=Sphingomonas sp. So64.6b TaxID=2997354 RepID=UPI0016001B3A|nr:type II and III secretion system protein family protein [Sphingomonas sp. So64.6b]QNA84766.1 type II and III secretion system protein family protein [Sphingomonas sp. So64.6b]